MIKKLKFILLSIGVSFISLSQKVLATTRMIPANNIEGTEVEIQSVSNQIVSIISRLGLFIGIPVVLIVVVLIIVLVIINKNKKK